MEETASQIVHAENQPRSEPASSPQTWRTPLTTSSLRQLRRGGENDPQSPTAVSPIMSRRTSFESDRYSTVSGLTTYFPNNPTNVNPAPVYVASSGASQVVSEQLPALRQPSSDDEEDDKPNKHDVQFTKPALALVNAFLDQLLYSFLSTARSTSLLALRPAVTEVLKHRLAKDAISSAEDELEGLLAGGDDDEEDAKHKITEDNRRWDLELVWKRTRLRVMVYMRLGEMEDEDEQRYVKEEELFHGNERRFSQSSGLVSWAAAIFLTSVLEYIAEQTLQVAGQASYTRVRRESRNQRLSGSTTQQKSDALVVEEYDVEKIALNATLGRLWRTWRKALRNNNASSPITNRSSMSNGRLSRENMMSAMSHRRSSFGTAHEGSVVSESRPMSRDLKDDGTEIEIPEHVMAANISLPMGDPVKDVDEIVVPGLAADPDAEDVEDADRIGHDEQYPAELLGSLVPLPQPDEQRDVDEIEVPGLARDPDAPIAEETKQESAIRRHSFTEAPLPRNLGDAADPVTSDTSSPFEASSRRQRSMSVPTPPGLLMSKDDEVAQEGPAAEENLDPTVDAGDSRDTEENADTGNAGDAETKDVSEPGATPSQPEGDQVAEDDARNETPEEKRKSEFPWMAAGATAASVAAAATGIWASKTQNVQTNQLDPDNNETQTTSLDTGEVPSQRSYSNEQIEELDRRKSLIDIKALMIVNGPSNEGSPEVEEPPSLDARAASEYRGVENVEDGISDQEGPEDAIGVARTSDVPASVQEQQSREASKRPSRLVLDDALPGEAADSPTIGQQPSPGTLQQKFLDLTPGTDQSQVERPRASSKSYSRVILTDGAQQIQGFEGSPHRESLTAPVERNTSKKQGSEYLTRTTSNSKGNEPKSPKTPKSPRLVSDPESLQKLTSASIRGPEDFDSFVQGGDTVKYTLTPETMRDDPGWTSAPQSRQAPVEMDATSTAVLPRSRSGRSQASKHATSAYTNEETSKAAKRRSVSKPPPRNTITQKKSGLMAREPQVMTESTRDFADFIRSTGPDKDTTVVPILANASQTSLHSLRSAYLHGASASGSSSPTGDRTRSLTNNADGSLSVPPVPPIPVKSKPNLEPRGARVSTNGTSDLIDFIRSGPSEQGTHRISRVVAPFRNTMDSDQMQEFADRSSVERSLEPKLSAGTASYQTASMRSSQRTSTNSRAPLLNGSSAVNQIAQPAYSSQPQRLSPAYGTSSRNAVAEQSEPSRKQVRAKDPYSMDFLDDDDDDDLRSYLPSREGETLAEFLNNNEPPRDNAPRPIVDPDSVQAREAVSRLRAGSSNTQRTAGSTRAATNGARPYSGTAAPVLPPIRSTTGSTRQKMVARGGARDIAANSNTEELVQFFRASGPDDIDGAPAPVVGRSTRTSTKDDKAAKKAEKKSGGFFSRSIKKKTYLDMP